MGDGENDLKFVLYSIDDLKDLEIDLELKLDEKDLRKLRFLVIPSLDIKILAVKELINRKERSRADYNKLRNSIHRLMIIPDIFSEPMRFKKGDSDATKDIIEIKAKNGHSRLMSFMYYGNIIVVTNFYWKTTDNRAPQNAAFEQAARIRKEFLKQHGEMNDE